MVDWKENQIPSLTFLQADNFFKILVEWAKYFQKICQIEDMFK